MSADLLPYYNQELSYIRNLAARFADAHPKIAARLRITKDTCDDPHVERLIEAFAYLTARVRHKLDDDFPELSEALLGVLYPHYVAPIPSMAIVQFDLDRAQNQLLIGHEVPRHAELETEPIDDEPCRFRTCYPVTLWPVELKSATLAKQPTPAPKIPQAHQVAAIVRLVLQCRDEKIAFSTLEMSSLRFFLKGQPQYIFRLYELLFNNVVDVVLANRPDDAEPITLGRACLRPVGFGREEGMLPYPPRSLLGYRLLTEFFAFPEKFLFLDVAGLNPKRLEKIGNQLELYIYLNQTSADLERTVSADTFRLGCAPVVNLYRQRAEPISLTHTEFEYRIVPDARRPLAHEVYSVERVQASSPADEQVEFQPFYAVRHATAHRAFPTFWYTSRRPAEPSEDKVDHGTEVYLSLVDLDFNPHAPADWTVDVEAICLNRDLPRRLPFGGDQPRLQLSEGGVLISKITCLTPPTATVRPSLRRGTLWRLVSHLSLNHLSLTGRDARAEGGSEDEAEALREVLKLYDFAGKEESRKMIEGILSVKHEKDVGRVGNAIEGGICRGVRVTVRFDEDAFTGGGLYLFAAVLEHFFGLYCTMNSFTRFVASTKHREGVLCRWPPRMGERVLA